MGADLGGDHGFTGASPVVAWRGGGGVRLREALHRGQGFGAQDGV